MFSHESVRSCERDHATKELWFTCANHTETAKLKLSNVTTTSAVENVERKKKIRHQTDVKSTLFTLCEIKAQCLYNWFQVHEKMHRKSSQNWSTHIQLLCFNRHKISR